MIHAESRSATLAGRGTHPAETPDSHETFTSHDQVFGVNALKSVFLRRGPKIKLKTVQHLVVSILHGMKLQVMGGQLGVGEHLLWE